MAFDGKERLCGEEAFAQISGDSTVAMLNNLMGRTLDDLQKSDPDSLKHRKVPISRTSERLTAEVTYADQKQKMHVPALMGMFIAKLKKRVWEEIGETAADTVLSFALPPNHRNTPSVERAYREACTIAGINESKLFIADAADCLVATYTRKLSGLNPSERSHLEVRKQSALANALRQSCILYFVVKPKESVCQVAKLGLIVYAFDDIVSAFVFFFSLMLCKLYSMYLG